MPFGAGLGFLYSVTTISGPPLALLFNNQGLVLVAQQRFDEAEVAYRRAVMLQPDYADALYSLAWILQHKELFDDALATWAPGATPCSCHGKPCCARLRR